MQPILAPTIYQHSFRAMGCQMHAWVDGDDAEAAADALAQVEALFAAHEQALSRFRPDSELVWVNGRSGQWTEVSVRFWQVLTLALDL
ncbi:MAG: FAD:protein FMN transferase, partial [Anaerolineales bacterium]|nr:FAD:protein FMN transferase [Anaerolineales bacterium]